MTTTTPNDNTQQKVDENSQAVQPQNEIAQNNDNSASQSQSNAQQSQASVSAYTPKNSRLDGFNFDNAHFDIRNFSGSGFTPADNNVYRWNDPSFHDWYLFEKLGSASNEMNKLTYGSHVVVDGYSYTVYDIHHSVGHRDFSIKDEQDKNGGIVMQTCEQSGYNSPLTMILAK